ncbi:MAG: thioesterase family protein [Desulfitobacterium hafniense]|nr:thioesterase family protein [Desulfitobacterium hafniense]
MLELKAGLTGKAEKIVKIDNTAKTLGSGSLDVYGTPALVALMEAAAVRALDLPSGQSSVGVSLDIKHLAATPVGMKVWALAELTEVDRRRLVFNVEAFDEVEKIGHGTHERFLIDEEKFFNKTMAKNLQTGE